MENKDKEEKVVLSVSRKDGDWIIDIPEEDNLSELLHCFVALGLYLEHYFGKDVKEYILDTMRKCSPEKLERTER